MFWTSAGGSRTDRVVVSVTNYGDAPVHELELGIDCNWYPSTEWQMRHALGPSATTEFVFDRPSTGNSTGASVDGVQLWFVDALGRRWKRQLVDLEPERIVEYVPPTLPEDIRKEIQANLRRSRRGHQKDPGRR